MHRFAALPSLFAVGLLLGCVSAPPTERAVADSGFPYRAAPQIPLPEPPEPFIRMVDLTRLRIGMSKAEVSEIFPDPRTIDVSVRGLEVWEYGFAQLHFRGGRLANWFDLKRL